MEVQEKLLLQSRASEEQRSLHQVGRVKKGNMGRPGRQRVLEVEHGRHVEPGNSWAVYRTRATCYKLRLPDSRLFGRVGCGAASGEFLGEFLDLRSLAVSFSSTHLR